MREKLIIVATLAMLMAVCFSADTDNFTITVTVNFIDFDLRNAPNTADYTNWPLGNVNPGSVTEMTTGTGGSHIYVRNMSNIALDFKAYSITAAPSACGFGTPTAWTPGASAGTNIYKLEIDKGELGAVPAVYTTITGTTLGSANEFHTTAAGESYRLYTKFTAPTVASDGCQHTITVYIIAVPD